MILASEKPASPAEGAQAAATCDSEPGAGRVPKRHRHRHQSRACQNPPAAAAPGLPWGADGEGLDCQTWGLSPSDKCLR